MRQISRGLTQFPARQGIDSVLQMRKKREEKEYMELPFNGFQNPFQEKFNN
jgi:hypothetical protein